LYNRRAEDGCGGLKKLLIVQYQLGALDRVVQICGSSVGWTGDRAGNASSRASSRPGVEKWDGDIYRESSHIQLTSHVFPPSDEKDCSIRDDLGEMLSQT
jgi:hypothetical protein